MTVEDKISYLEKRIKLLEENLSWTQRDMIHLINFVESVEPEIHYHLTYDFRTCKDYQK